MYMCVFTRNMPRFHSQILNPTQAPATLVCAGSFISSAIAGPRFPLGFWTGFKTLIIAAATSQCRACESGDQLVSFFFFLSPSPTSFYMPDNMEPSCLRRARPRTPSQRAPGFWGHLTVADWQQQRPLSPRALQVVYPDSEVCDRNTSLMFCCFVNSLTDFVQRLQITAGAALPRRNS